MCEAFEKAEAALLLELPLARVLVKLFGGDELASAASSVRDGFEQIGPVQLFTMYGCCL